MPKNAANAEVVDKGCPSVTIIYCFTKTLLHEYNLLELFMKYNLLNVAAFKELPKIIKHLYTILGNYEYFNSRSVEIIINMAVIVLNNAADITLSDGEVIGAGTYACRKSIKDDVTRNDLRDFIILVESIRKKILDNDWYRLQEK